MIENRDGLPLTAADATGAARLDDAIESYLASRADTPRIVKQAMEADPQHLMARCFMGYLTKLAGDARNAATAAALHGDLRRRVEAGAGTPWERDHVTALGLWLAGDLHALMAHFESVVDRYPPDLLSLRILHYLYFYDGDAERMRSSVATRLSSYQGHPLESYLKGMLAFGLEEAGDYASAERYGREAVETRPGDLWAVHAVAHVMEMQGRAAEGAEWLEASRPGWDEGNNFRFHLDWHQALFHLTAGEPERALALYDRAVGPAVADDFYLDVCNAASLLLRLQVAGCDVGERWQPLAEVAERHVADTALVFASLHYLMPLLVTGSPAAERLRANLTAWAQTGTTQGEVVRVVGLAVAEFLAAWRAGEGRRALALFESFRANLHRIGGSHAQRALFHLLADDAAGTGTAPTRAGG